MSWHLRFSLTINYHDSTGFSSPIFVLNKNVSANIVRHDKNYRVSKTALKSIYIQRLKTSQKKKKKKKNTHLSIYCAWSERYFKAVETTATSYHTVLYKYYRLWLNRVPLWYPYDISEA